MAVKIYMLAIATFAMVASASATTYIVGDSANWNLPSSPTTYSDWAADKNFVVGDVLVFNFRENGHDVTEVTKSGYDNCNGANAISQFTSSPTNVTLNSAGEHHYICTVATHCSSGQKLAINVAAAKALTPTPQSGDNSPSSAPIPSLVPRSSPPSASVPASGPTRPTTTRSPPTTATTTASPPPEGNGAASLAGIVGVSLSAAVLALLF